jgi:hypothetical protein
MRILSACGTGTIRLLATLLGRRGVLLLRIVQPVGSIVLLGLLAKAIRLQLADLRTRFREFLCEFFIPFDGLPVSALPIPDLTAQLRYFAP